MLREVQQRCPHHMTSHHTASHDTSSRLKSAHGPFHPQTPAAPEPPRHDLLLVRRMHRCPQPTLAAAARGRARELRCDGNARRRRRVFAAICRASRFCEQIAAYCVSALASGVMLLRWWRMGGERRQRVWRLCVLLFPRYNFVTFWPGTDGSARSCFAAAASA